MPTAPSRLRAFPAWRAVATGDPARLLRRLAAAVEELVTGGGSVVGQRLVEHPDVAKGSRSGTAGSTSYNNAGISPADDDSILETGEEAWQRVQDVNTKGVYLCCKHGIPYLLERGGGSVINVASFVALVGAATSQISYTTSKGAVLSMSRELGVQFARQGVRVNALCPGPVETPLLLRIFGDDPAAYERRRMHLPMGRLAKPREIVNAALFLASDESSYVNGATFLVDGGLTAAYVTPE
jgi:NAD(P)-dependent dehydrogenase (short-subunit alcohol dehydrogenase family)